MDKPAGDRDQRSVASVTNEPQSEDGLEARTEPGATATAPRPSAPALLSSPVPAKDSAKDPAKDLVVGYIDGIQGRRVFGWAWCRSRPAVRVEVEIRLDGQPVRTVLADSLRPDLTRNGVGDGQHGFNVQLDETVGADEKARISAWGRCSPDEGWVQLVNRVIPPPRPIGDEHEQDGVRPFLQRGAIVPVSNMQPVLSALEGLRKDIDERFALLRRELPADVARLLAARKTTRPDPDESQDLRKQLTALAASTDVLQMRIDATCAALQERSTAVTSSSRRGDRTLTIVVVGLGIISSVALLLGLIAVFR